MEISGRCRLAVNLRTGEPFEFVRNDEHAASLLAAGWAVVDYVPTHQQPRGAVDPGERSAIVTNIGADGQWSVIETTTMRHGPFHDRAEAEDFAGTRNNPRGAVSERDRYRDAIDDALDMLSPRDDLHEDVKLACAILSRARSGQAATTPRGS
jgi:hypothetical protein